MYPNLFGNPALKMYDLIGVLGYAFIIAFFLLKKDRSSWGRTLLLVAVHLVAYTFGGELLGDVLGRGTEFFGYIAVSAVAMVLAAGATGQSPLRRLDDTVPLYLSLASALKLSCFCGGCCNGQPWAYGFYNHQTEQREFPIQLVEAALYALLLLALSGYRGRPGRRFSLFLMGYAGVRFAVQFVRADVAVFTPFHWMSGVFFGIGTLCLVLSFILPQKDNAQ